MAIKAEDIFESVRRGYDDLELADSRQILDYFANVEDEFRMGHVSNIKGILFERLYVNNLADQGIAASVFEATNHPLVDISVDQGSGLMLEMQLKATDSPGYVLSSMSENPDIPFVVTSEVADGISHAHLIDSDISNEALEHAVTETLFTDYVNPFSALSVLRWIVGIPF
ncbi:hypothetical protein [Microvirga aerophila]|uniref:Uncharacterized protein n=1 Tax=Microvirga aerophila TaxID=670291 RepID=A0A512BKY4_9HYPH|nr:hypothetical protein [Microvirga aerophila]GEO12634.1 hypothetical protein MAE02_03300 [Microvirga aerophila]